MKRHDAKIEEVKMNNSIAALREKYQNVPIHFIGIGGCGMSALALFVHQLGADVSGSDKHESMYFRSLKKAGIKVFAKHDAGAVTDKELVVVSSAISASNVEIMMARQLGITVIHRSGLLAEIASYHKAITVCGAHGKTTTATLLAHLLTCCNFNPSYIIGGLPKYPMRHAYFGGTEMLIMEADESDRSILKYAPDLAIVTNIDLDHTRDGGYTCKEDVARVIGTMVSKAHSVFVSEQASRYLRLTNSILVQYRTFGGDGTFLLNGNIFKAMLPGECNMQNCAMASAVAMDMGCNNEEINQALVSFAGVNRRFDVVGKMSNGADVMIDYSHHPNEVMAVIETVRHKYSGRIIVVFQPHLYSRTVRFAKDFAEALNTADNAFVVEIFASRELADDWPGVSSSLIVGCANGSRVKPMPSQAEFIEKIKNYAIRDDCVLVLGAGDIYELGHILARY